MAATKGALLTNAHNDGIGDGIAGRARNDGGGDCGSIQGGYARNDERAAKPYSRRHLIDQ